MRALTRLVKKFPKDIRPTFHNYDRTEMKFPFELHEKDQHPTKPDVIATIPALRRVAPLYRWRHIAIVFELKSRREDDPMLTESQTNWETLIQLAKSARNIMAAQGRLFCFVVGMYGGQARIFRFDHAGAICSPAFEYQERPEILHKFLWRLFHPAIEGCSMVGDDPTVILGTKKDRERAEKLAREHDPEWKHTPETRKAVRKFKIKDEEGTATEYLAYKLISMNPRLFSRSTVIWEAFKLDKKGKSTRNDRYIIKDTWRQLGRLDEAGFYEMLWDEETDETVFGAARCVWARDYGAETAEERRDIQAKKQEPVYSHRGEDISDSSVEDKQLIADILAGHRTVSAAHNRDTALDGRRLLEEVHLYERSHVRLILQSVGTPLSEFKDTKELAMAFRDAIEGMYLYSSSSPSR